MRSNCLPRRKCRQSPYRLFSFTVIIIHIFVLSMNINLRLRGPRRQICDARSQLCCLDDVLESAWIEDGWGRNRAKVLWGAVSPKLEARLRRAVSRKFTAFGWLSAGVQRLQSVCTKSSDYRCGLNDHFWWDSLKTSWLSILIYISKSLQHGTKTDVSNHPLPCFYLGSRQRLKPQD